MFNKPLSLSLLPVVLLGVSAPAGCEPVTSKPDTAAGEGTVVTIECPYRFWTPDDYVPGEPPDPYACTPIESGESVVVTQIMCPDNDTDNPLCGGPEVPHHFEDGYVCAACTTLHGEVYEGHPSYLGDCDPGDLGCQEQPEPPWTHIRFTFSEAE